MRKEDSHRSEMVNQLLFGETMSLLEQKGEWLRVRTLYDDYEGWLTQHLVTPVTETVALAEPFYVASSLVNPVTLPDQLINLPMGSFLTGYDEETRLLWDPDYKYHGTFRDIRKPFASDLLRKTIHAWINAPYLWGGKTFMGVDCSGFVQTVFKLLGKKLPRDAYQQALTGTAISNLGEAAEGDLCFFNNEEGRIVHVGILLSQQQVIHAAGKVRVDRIDPGGIINIDHGKRTHTLHSIKRML